MRFAVPADFLKAPVDAGETPFPVGFGHDHVFVQRAHERALVPQRAAQGLAGPHLSVDVDQHRNEAHGLPGRIALARQQHPHPAVLAIAVAVQQFDVDVTVVAHRIADALHRHRVGIGRTQQRPRAPTLHVRQAVAGVALESLVAPQHAQTAVGHQHRAARVLRSPLAQRQFGREVPHGVAGMAHQPRLPGAGCQHQAARGQQGIGPWRLSKPEHRQAGQHHQQARHQQDRHDEAEQAQRALVHGGQRSRRCSRADSTSTSRGLSKWASAPACW